LKAQPSRTVICLSSQQWDNDTWTNKQHIMSRLAERHRVIHIDFGYRRFSLHRKYLKSLTGGGAEYLKALQSGIIPRGDGLWTGHSARPTKVHRLPLENSLRDIFEFRTKVSIGRRFARRMKDDRPVWWVYHPGFGGHLDRMKPRGLLVYDCVDDYSAFPELKAHAPWLMEREERLCREADLVFTTSRSLYETKRHLNSETHLVHNVGDAEHFSRVMDPGLPVSAETGNLEGPVIGFVGAVSDYKLNLDWLCHAAAGRPRWQFVLIGPVGLADPGTDVSRLASMDNVHMLGRRDYSELPALLKGVDVTVIPYRMGSATDGVFPIKFFEFMATGKPVVISRLPALKEFYDSVLVARDAEEFVEKCEEALQMGDRGQKVRLELAEANSWSSRISIMMEHIERVFANKHS